MLEERVGSPERSAERSERSERSGADLSGGSGNASESHAAGPIISLPGRAVEPEVVAIARRRRFSAEYKLRILEEADQCRDSLEIGLLLRQEGLYSGHLYRWRKWRREMSKKKDGTKGMTGSMGDLRNENARLKRENARLQLKLKKAEALLELQKKASEILGMTDLSESGSD
jgi:transposase